MPVTSASREAETGGLSLAFQDHVWQHRDPISQQIQKEKKSQMCLSFRALVENMHTTSC